MSTKEDIEILIEGGTATQQSLITMVAMNALATSGFHNSHQLDHQGHERPYNPISQKLTMPTVLDYMRQAKPELFVTPVLVSAYTPDPRETKKELVDHEKLTVLNLAVSYEDLDPDVEWNKYSESEKERILRIADSRYTALTF